MTFAEFKNSLPQITRADLPGKEAQYLLAPAHRPVNHSRAHLAKAQKAAVLALIVPLQGEAHLVLTKRTAYPGTHGGQMSFPGGKKEAQDKNLRHTALRETHEEVGVPEEGVEIIRELSDLYIPPSNFWVQPILSWSSHLPHFHRDPVEVERIHLVPLSLILSSTAVQKVVVRPGYEAPAFRFEQEVIWGATAMIMSEIATLLRQNRNRADRQGHK